MRVKLWACGPAACSAEDVLGAYAQRSGGANAARAAVLRAAAPGPAWDVWEEQIVGGTQAEPRGESDSEDERPQRARRGDDASCLTAACDALAPDGWTLHACVFLDVVGDTLVGTELPLIPHTPLSQVQGANRSSAESGSTDAFDPRNVVQSYSLPYEGAPHDSGPWTRANLETDLLDAPRRRPARGAYAEVCARPEKTRLVRVNGWVVCVGILHSSETIVDMAKYLMGSEIAAHGGGISGDISTIGGCQSPGGGCESPMGEPTSNLGSPIGGESPQNGLPQNGSPQNGLPCHDGPDGESPHGGFIDNDSIIDNPTTPHNLIDIGSDDPGATQKRDVQSDDSPMSSDNEYEDTQIVDPMDTPHHVDELGSNELGEYSRIKVAALNGRIFLLEKRSRARAGWLEPARVDLAEPLLAAACERASEGANVVKRTAQSAWHVRWLWLDSHALRWLSSHKTLAESSIDVGLISEVKLLDDGTGPAAAAEGTGAQKEDAPVALDARLEPLRPLGLQVLAVDGRALTILFPDALSFDCFALALKARVAARHTLPSSRLALWAHSLLLQRWLGRRDARRARRRLRAKPDEWIARHSRTLASLGLDIWDPVWAGQQGLATLQQALRPPLKTLLECRASLVTAQEELAAMPAPALEAAAVCARLTSLTKEALHLAYTSLQVLEAKAGLERAATAPSALPQTEQKLLRVVVWQLWCADALREHLADACQRSGTQILADWVKETENTLSGYFSKAKGYIGGFT